MHDFLTPLQEAAYNTVHDYKDPRTGRKAGAAGLAPRVTKSPSLLSNEVNPTYAGAKLGYEDAGALMLAANDFQMLHALSALCGHVSIPLPDFRDVSDEELLEVVSRYYKEVGEASAAFHEAIASRNITGRKIQDLEREGYEAIQAWLELVARIKTLQEAN